ncbi:hypothetical protein HY024_01180 [Candidatus Curtissbacteria bacterium]|nr:hypothetical protein [Candidatus Curtissbacteria bacterium]
MFSYKKRNDAKASDLINSALYDEKSFYQAFIKDLSSCREEVFIESPYITNQRMRLFRPIFEKLVNQGVRINIMTRDPKEHDLPHEYQAEDEIRNFESVGVQTLLCVGNHHRKLAILDRKVLWEGSLNILSQANSREIMRRIESRELALQMHNFLKLENFL